MTNEQTTQDCNDCLETLLNLPQDHLRDELEQLLLSLHERGSNLNDLNNYLSQGGSRRLNQ